MMGEIYHSGDTVANPVGRQFIALCSGRNTVLVIVTRLPELRRTEGA